MWEKLLSWARFLWDAGQKSEQNSRQLGEAQEQIQRLSELNKFLYIQLEHERELRGEQIESLRREIADSQEPSSCVCALNFRKSCGSCRREINERLEV